MAGSTIDMSALDATAATPVIKVVEGETIVLPSDSGQITIQLPDNFGDSLTLRLERVMGSGTLTLAGILSKFLASDGTNKQWFVSVNGELPNFNHLTYDLELLLRQPVAATMQISDNTFTLTSGDFLGAFGHQVNYLVIDGGIFFPTNNVNLNRLVRLTWRGGQIYGSVTGSGVSELLFEPAKGDKLSVSGNQFVNFGEIIKAGAGEVVQTGTLGGTSFELREGTYTIAESGVLKVAMLTVMGGTLADSGSSGGTVVFNDDPNQFQLIDGTIALKMDLGGGADNFLWTGGSIDGGKVDGGDGEDTITVDVARGENIDFRGHFHITGFEKFYKTGAGSVSQTSPFSFYVDTVYIQGGSFILKNGGIQAESVIMSGEGSTLEILANVFSSDFALPGATVSTPSDDENNQRIIIAVSSPFNNNVDLGGGDEDRLVLDSSDKVLDISANQGGYFRNIEILEITGVNGASWGSSLTVGNVGGFQQLAFTTAGTSFTVTGSLTFLAGSMIDVAGMGGQSASVSVGATDVIRLPTGAESLSIRLPNDFDATLTITLTNVASVENVDLEAILAKFKVVDSDGIAGEVVLSGSAPDVTSTYTLVFTAKLGHNAVFTNTLVNGAYTFTLQGGRYANAFPASVTHLTVVDGTLTHAGTAQLVGDSTLTWSGGRIFHGVDASAGTGNDRIVLAHASAATLLELDGADFVGFEVLTHGHAGRTIQSGVLRLEGGAVTISAGSYTLASGAELHTNSMVLKDNGQLRGEGKVVLHGDSTFTINVNALREQVLVDASHGEGEDVLLVNPALTGLELDGSLFSGFEKLTKSGASKLTWRGNLVFGGSGGDFATLQLPVNTENAPLEVVMGDLIIDSGATLDVVGLTAVSGDSTLTFGAVSAGHGVVFSSTLSHWTIQLPDSFTETLTLTLENVVATDVDLAAVLASLRVESVLGLAVANITLQGTIPSSGIFDLVLMIQFESMDSHDFSNDGTTATLTSGTYAIAFSSSETAQDLSVTGGWLAGASKGDARGKVILQGASTFTWTAGRVTAEVDASDASGYDTIDLNPALGIDLKLAGGLMKGFERMTKNGAGQVTQSGTLRLLEQAILNAGVYHLNSGAILSAPKVQLHSGATLSSNSQINLGDLPTVFTLNGGTLSVALTLAGGADRFIWRSGALTTQVSGGQHVDTLEFSPDGSLTLDQSMFSDLEVWLKSGAGTLTVPSELQLDPVAGKFVVEEGALVLEQDLHTFSFELVDGAVRGAGAIRINAYGSFTWSGGELNVDVYASGDNARLIIGSAFTDLADVLAKFNNFDHISFENDLTQLNLKVLFAMTSFGDGAQAISIDLSDLTVSESTLPILALGGGQDTFRISANEGGEGVVVVDGGSGRDVLIIDTSEGNVDLGGSTFFGFEDLQVVGAKEATFLGGDYTNVVVGKGTTVRITEILSVVSNFFLEGRLTGGVLAFVESGFEDGSLKVGNGYIFSSPTEVRLTGQLMVVRGGTVEDTVIRMEAASAELKSHYVAGVLGTEGKPVKWHGSFLGDTLRFSGELHSGSTLDFGSGDDTLIWTGGLLAGGIHGGAHSSGDRLVVELGTGATITKAIVASQLKALTGFEKLYWQTTNVDSDAVQQSAVLIAGAWNFCDTSQDSCISDAQGVSPSGHAAELHVQSGVRYAMGINSQLNFGRGGQLVLGTGTTSLELSMQQNYLGPPDVLGEVGFEVNFAAGTNLLFEDVSNLENAASLSISGGGLYLLGDVGVFLHSNARYVLNAPNGVYTFTLRLNFDASATITLPNGEAFVPKSTLYFGTERRDANLLLNTDEVQLLEELTAMFTRVGAYEGALFYSGDVSVAVTPVDEDALVQKLRTITVTFTFDSNDLAEELPSPSSGSAWALWESFNLLSQGDEALLARIYHHSLNPTAYAALGEDLVHYQMGNMDRLLVRQREQSEMLRREGVWHYDDRQFSMKGWVLNDRQSYVRGDGVSDADNEFHGALQAAGVVVALSQNTWLGSWLGASQVQRKHDADNHTSNQSSHRYDAVWSGIYGEQHVYGARVTAMLAHSKGEVESNRRARVGQQVLTAEGEFDMDVWHVHMQVAPERPWQWQTISLDLEFQLRYHQSHRSTAKEYLLLDGAVGNYHVVGGVDKVLHGGAALHVTSTRGQNKPHFTLGYSKELKHDGARVAGSAPGMPMLSADDASSWKVLYYAKYTQDIKLTDELKVYFTLETESNLEQHTSNQATFNIRHNF